MTRGSRAAVDAQIQPVCPADHKHGQTPTCYTTHRCRCSECRTGAADYARAAHRLKAYGRWDPRRPASVVRVHIISLQRFGYTYEQIARVADVNPRTIYACLSGEMRWMQTQKAEAILAVTPNLDDLGPANVIDGTGTVRRVQALARRGWTLIALARHAGLPSATLRGAVRTGHVTVRVHRAVATAYEELWDRSPDASTAARRAAIARTIEQATAAGWAPPLAWDDIDTDDAPSSDSHGETSIEEDIDEIAVQHAVDGHRVRLTRAERHAALRILHARGHYDRALADLLCVNVKTIGRDRDELGLEANFFIEQEAA